MSEIKLTHEQVAMLRVNRMTNERRRELCAEMETLGVYRAYQDGLAAIAAYDAEWVAVQRSDLREVLDLLNTFFGFPEDSGGGRLMAALEAKC